LEQEEEKRKEKKTLACVNWNYINPKQSTVWLSATSEQMALRLSLTFHY
jgi:hypothetical protein